MRKAYSYLRFSSNKQEKGDSLRRQISLRDAWLARKGLKLDDSLTIRDLGVSAFRGKNLTKGALAGFIAAVQAGRVEKGSYLVIEKLDRFSRDDADETLPIFTKLVKSGITIVTVDPEKEWDEAAIKGFGIIELVLQFVLANQESQKRSDRLTAVWVEKKKNAATKLLTKRLPSWLKLEDGKPVKDPTKTAIVKRIFDLAEKGHGSSQIAKMFNKEKLPSMLWGTGWHGASINKLLRGRAVLGEYQPCKITPEGPTRRVPVGEPVPNYYPAVIKEAQFRRVQLALDGRRLARGKIGRAVTNLFQGLLYDARDGGKVKSKFLARSSYLMPKNADRGLPGKKWAFSYDTFERFILWLVKELTPKQLRPASVEKQETDTQDRLIEVERRIETIKEKMSGDGEFDSLLDVLGKLDAQRKTLIEKAKTEQALTPANQERDLKEAKSVADLLDKAKGEELIELRVRLKGMIRSLVKDIWVIVENVDATKIMLGMVYLRGGGVRPFNIYSAGKGVGMDADGGSGEEKPRQTIACDLREYASNAKIRKRVDELFSRLSLATPQRMTLHILKTSGKKPYVVAKQLGIANSTVYRWARQAGMM